MQCGGTAPAIMQNGQDHMEESERYCRKCELAKQYGTNDSPAFVNGILAKFAE